MQSKSFLTRAICLPIDLIRMIVLSLWISLWHLLVIVKSTIFRVPPIRAFCHPDRIDTGTGVRVNICPFARKFGSPGLFALLCNYCRRSQRPGSENLYLCRRRGIGPASSITQVCFGVLPILVVIAALVWHLQPGTRLVEDVSTLLEHPTRDKAPQQRRPRRPKPPVRAVYEPAPVSMKSDDDKKPEIPPMPTPERGAQIEVPPPPMGYGPQDRRVVAVTPPPPTISDVTKHGPSASELLAQARQASRQEEYDTVQRLASQLLAKKPNDLDALLLLARAQLAAGKISPARTTSERVLTLHPNTAEAHAILGKIHLDKGRTRDAKVEYEHALKLDPACALARAGLARILILGTAQN